MLAQEILSGSALDRARANLRTKTRSWLGRAPRNSGRQYPVVPGMAGSLLVGEFVGLTKDGQLTRLGPGLRFCGVFTGAGLDSRGETIGSVRVGRLWESISGLALSTGRGCVVYADPENLSLNLSAGLPIGTLTDLESFSNGFRGHIELKVSE